MPILILLFALVALIYASVGFGGGSTYTALLALSDVDYRLIPIVSLLCNLVVVTGGIVRYTRAGQLDLRACLPLVILSAPMSFLGGMVTLSQAAFFGILGGALFLSSAALFLPIDRLPRFKLKTVPLIGLSALIGLLAGLSGIGGGIFFAPILHLIRWADARRIAAFSSLYILINSAAGLAGQFWKQAGTPIWTEALSYWPLLLAVLIGGQIGGMIGLKLLSPRYLRWITGILVGYVALRLIWRAVNPN
ncbi:sulfite exporter TauE/SafE family protein [Sphingorhabdus arenilitoris]|uniref:Probable membrane transporter protein n=1 Tax=Sphingorhabdus arenilitoris TaxID=1490041 RepID=A0ABV8RI76_9SPHN